MKSIHGLIGVRVIKIANIWVGFENEVGFA